VCLFFDEVWLHCAVWLYCGEVCLECGMCGCIVVVCLYCGDVWLYYGGVVVLLGVVVFW
jgi:hypothetical protein